MVLFDFDDAFGMTDLECENYVPEDMHVIGNLRAAQVAMERYGSVVIFNGNEYTDYAELHAVVAPLLSGNEA